MLPEPHRTIHPNSANRAQTGEAKDCCARIRDDKRCLRGTTPSHIDLVGHQPLDEGSCKVTGCRRSGDAPREQQLHSFISLRLAESTTNKLFTINIPTHNHTPASDRLRVDLFAPVNLDQAPLNTMQRATCPLQALSGYESASPLHSVQTCIRGAGGVSQQQCERHAHLPLENGAGDSNRGPRNDQMRKNDTTIRFNQEAEGETSSSGSRAWTPFAADFDPG